MDYCIFFHQIGAQYNNFPNVALSDLPKVLIQIGFCTEENASAFIVKVMEKFKDLRPEILPETPLNRMLFIEVLIMFAVEENAKAP